MKGLLDATIHRRYGEHTEIKSATSESAPTAQFKVLSVSRVDKAEMKGVFLEVNKPVGFKVREQQRSTNAHHHGQHAKRANAPRATHSSDSTQASSCGAL